MTGQDMSRFGRVGVLCGGMSSERQISLQSGEAVLAGLLDAGVDAVKLDIGADAVDQIRSSKINRAFLVLHGPGGKMGVCRAFWKHLEFHIPAVALLHQLWPWINIEPN